MNFIDIIVLVALLFAVFNGWRQGVIVQLCSMVSIFCGIWLGVRYGQSIGQWLHIGDSYAFVCGLLIVTVAIVVGVAVVSRLMKKMFKFAGLGLFDTVLGILLSICSVGLILSILFGVFDHVNNNLDIVKQERLERSKFYAPIIKISDNIFPALNWTKKQISSGLEKL